MPGSNTQTIHAGQEAERMNPYSNFLGTGRTIGEDSAVQDVSHQAPVDGYLPAPSSTSASKSDVTVAVITTLPCEFNASLRQLDEYDADRKRLNETIMINSKPDFFVFVQGKILGQQILLVKLMSPGVVDATGTAQHIAANYSSIKLIIVAGVCAGVAKPSNGADLLIGDVVIGNAVLPYADGLHWYPDKVAQRNNMLQRSLSRKVRSLLGVLEDGLLISQFEERLNTLQSRPPNLGRLFPANYHHVHRRSSRIPCTCDPDTGEACEDALRANCNVVGCDDSMQIDRTSTDDGRIHVRIGPYASAPIIMRNPAIRDQMAERFGILAFEMELTGLWASETPVVPIKGVCDYADSHKNKDWQEFAADTAACAMKEFIRSYLGPG
ncbi:phosphorylase superfamily protein [Apiospora saccharicola]|uniref:Phosphorylase superfamily protein n=1 Tax=Apiospora saccharicola TaxID=335842 RepID=A0ABR1WCW8_9PEZI